MYNRFTKHCGILGNSRRFSRFSKEHNPSCKSYDESSDNNPQHCFTDKWMVENKLLKQTLKTRARVFKGNGVYTNNK